MSAPKPTELQIEALLRRVEDPHGSWSSEEVANMRHATDEQFELVFRDPTRWSYVVRGPRGDLVAWGKGRSRAECLRNGADLAEAWGLEQFDDTWRLDGDWRFMLWPPRH